MIVIIDYGMGNLHSVSKAVERLGYTPTITSDPAVILQATGAILPGVGAFGDAMEHLRETGLDEVVKQFAASGKPLLGICLGMQLLFTQSEEHGVNQGLNLLPGKVVRFQGSYKIPHMGWNKLTHHHKENPIFEGIEEGFVYFVHSYHAKLDNTDDLLASAAYFQPVTAIVGRDNIYGMQFHPEKSSDVGMALLRNFLKMSEA